MHFYFDTYKYTNNPKLKRKSITYIIKSATNTSKLEYTSQYKNDPQLFNNFYKKVNNQANPNTFGISTYRAFDGVIQGIVTENDKPIPNCTLFLYQSSTGVLAARTVSKSDGSFSYTAIAPDVTYFIAASHPQLKFNAVVLDDIRIDSRV